jgi:glutathionyl-hydroquinone reductase
MFDEQERMNEMWDDYFAKDDAIRERYHREAEDMRNESLMSDEHQEYLQKVYDAGFGEDVEAYEESWKRTLNYYENQGV